tara:strand:+ start:542 stop:691 length:150 start_codon:yes stop_codon:yes gene_type:complete
MDFETKRMQKRLSEVEKDNKLILNKLFEIADEITSIKQRLYRCEVNDEN